jgi:hypothetical protein
MLGILLLGILLTSPGDWWFNWPMFGWEDVVVVPFALS